MQAVQAQTLTVGARIGATTPEPGDKADDAKRHQPLCSHLLRVPDPARPNRYTGASNAAVRGTRSILRIRERPRKPRSTFVVLWFGLDRYTPAAGGVAIADSGVLLVQFDADLSWRQMSCQDTRSAYIRQSCRTEGDETTRRLGTKV